MGEEYVIFSWREIVRCICSNHARNGVAIVVTFKNLFTLGTISQLKDFVGFVTVRSASKLFAKKLLWQQTTAD